MDCGYSALHFYITGKKCIKTDGMVVVKKDNKILDYWSNNMQ